MNEDRKQLLKKLVMRQGNFEDLSAALVGFEWDYADGAPLILDKAALVNILHDYLRDSASAEDVEQWAEFLEVREDIDYMEEQEGAVSKVMHALANPDLEGALTKERARRLLSDLG